MHEQDKYYVMQQPILGKPFKVLTRKRAGIPTGEYIGFYNPKRDIITLYPTKGAWRYGGLKRHEISIRDPRVINNY